MILVNLICDCGLYYVEPATPKEIFQVILVTCIATALFSSLFLWLLEGIFSLIG